MVASKGPIAPALPMAENFGATGVIAMSSATLISTTPSSEENLCTLKML